MTELATWPLY